MAKKKKSRLRVEIDQDIRKRPHWDDQWRPDGMELRAKVLHRTLYIEHVMEQILCNRLTIHMDNSLRFTFEMKVRFLSELRAVDPKEVLQIDDFRIIRNHFIHELETSTFTKCLELHPDIRTRLLQFANTSIGNNPGALNSEGILFLGFERLADSVAAPCERLQTEDKEWEETKRALFVGADAFRKSKLNHRKLTDKVCKESVPGISRQQQRRIVRSALKAVEDHRIDALVGAEIAYENMLIREAEEGLRPDPRVLQ